MRILKKNQMPTTAKLPESEAVLVDEGLFVFLMACTMNESAIELKRKS